MAKANKAGLDSSLLAAALEGLELQKQRIEQQIQQVRGMLGKRGPRPTLASPDFDVEKIQAPKRDLSPAARKRIAMAQKRRWAEYRRNASQRANATGTE